LGTLRPRASQPRARSIILETDMITPDPVANKYPTRNSLVAEQRANFSGLPEGAQDFLRRKGRNAIKAERNRYLAAAPLPEPVFSDKPAAVERMRAEALACATICDRLLSDGFGADLFDPLSELETRFLATVPPLRIKRASEPQPAEPLID